MSKTRSKTTDGSPNMMGATLQQLGSTVGSFTNRINKGLKEKEQRSDEAARARDLRHAHMMQAMTTIRKALQETCKIRLGSRFGFRLDVSDWEGWPRVILFLVDSLLPEWEELALITTANDHKDQGVIQLNLKSGEILGRVYLCNQSEIERIPVVLKRSVRDFLDIVGEYVLNPLSPEEVEKESKPIALEDETPELDEVADKLKKEQVFSDTTEYSPADNLVSDEPLSQPIKDLGV